MSVTTVITNGSPSANIRNICGPVNGNNSKYYVGFQGTGQAINRVQLKLANHASAQNNSTSMWQVQIYSSTSQNPGPSTAQVKPNALLYSSNLKSRADVNAITPNSVFFDIDFPSAFTLANGTWYVLVLLCISGTWDYGVNMIYVNCLDTRPANIFGQWTGNAWYDLSSGYYNCIAFQLQYVSSGGGGGCDCDTINNPLTIKHNYVNFTNSLIDLRKWMYREKIFSGGNTFATIGTDANNAVGLRFKDPTTGKWTDVFGSLLFSNSSDPDPRPGFAVNDHLYVRRDFFVRGQVNSMEGAIMLYGNGYNAVNSSSPDWWIGWGPRIGTPFIHLAQGGAHMPSYGLGGNPAAETLLIVTNSGGPNNSNNNINSAYSYGDVECRDVVAHGFLNTAHLRTLWGYSIYVYNNLIPNGSNISLGEDIAGRRFENLHINSDIVCRGYVNTAHIRTIGGTTVNLHNDLMPNASNSRNFGSASRYWAATFGNEVYGKTARTFGCERSLSGKEWIQLSNKEDAEKALTHEVRKKLYHITYSEENEDEIICTCGKSVKKPCPEHLDAWNDRYTRNETMRLEAASFLVLEHSAELVKLSEALEAANKKIHELEQKLAHLGKVKNVD